MHIVFTIANNSSVPYFKWFAEKAAQTKEHRFTFVMLHKEKPTMIEEAAKYGWDCHWIFFDSNRRKSGMIAAFFKLYSLYKKLKPDVVHSHLFDDSLPSLLAARLAGIKKRVITKQDTTFHYYYAPKWVIADKFNNWNATHIHAVASNNKEFIEQKEKAPKEKIHLVRNGFPFKIITDYAKEDIAQLKETYNLDNRIVVGTVARYIHWKGHHLIIEAAKEIVQKHPNILFIWAGTDGGTGYKEELQKRIIAENLQKNIIILGWIERKMMPSLYQCMDIYLHPAINEPFGFAITEALMNKIPILCTKTGSSDLIEHLKNGYMMSEDSSEDIVTGLTYYLNNQEQTTIIAENGLKHALENLTFDKMYEGHLKMYESN